jgi:hypothetical protein
MTRRHCLVLLLACLVAITGCGGSHHTIAPPDATRRPPVGPVGARTAASLFAAAYVRFLDGIGTVAALPGATMSARALAAQAGPVPAARRRGTLVLWQPRAAQDQSDSYLLAARDDAHTFYAQIALRERQEHWVVAQLTPPDFVQTFAPAGPQPPAPPRGSAAAQDAAVRFLRGYLSWLYGQAPLYAIQAATSGLLATLRTHPPRVPPAMRSLHARIAAIALQRRRSGWQALPNITDGRETYELVLTITPARHGWLVSKVGSPQ